MTGEREDGSQVCLDLAYQASSQQVAGAEGASAHGGGRDVEGLCYVDGAKALYGAEHEDRAEVVRQLVYLLLDEFTYLGAHGRLLRSPAGALRQRELHLRVG